MKGEEILPTSVVTNRITVEINWTEFEAKYAIVSYESNDSEYKNLAYEQLSQVPCEAVTGLRNRWDGERNTIRFFILAKKGKENDVLNSLRACDKVRSCIDTLSQYTLSVRERIIASLAINSLGMAPKGKMMYCDGSLLICDDRNFLIPKSRKELVCLRIEVNEYMILTAKTVSFSNPIKIEQLKKYRNCVFKASKDIYGQWWSGLAIQPVVAKSLDLNKEKLENLYILKKRFSDRHNIIPYWPYNPDDYMHGRLYAITQVVSSVNERYDGLIAVDFSDNSIRHYDSYLPEEDVSNLLSSYFSGRNMRFEDDFKSEDSQRLIGELQSHILSLTNGHILFDAKATDAMVIRLCEPIDAGINDSHYIKSMARTVYCNNALQHIIFDSEKVKTVSKSEARRILIELLVKDCLIKRKLPNVLADFLAGWRCIRYKINNGIIIGAELSVVNNDLEIKGYSLSCAELPVEFEDFVREKLKYPLPERLYGARDYMVLEKNGNIYMIIDTDEIPILDVAAIDDGYREVVGGEPLSLFKRVKVARKYLGGYAGLNVWQTAGIDDESHVSYSYIAGFNRQNMKIMRSTKMDKMPRARRLFILHSEKEDAIENQVLEIMDMLKLGFGRWNELMTYPFPFKFLQEYLDDAVEMAYGKHWKDISFKGEL